MKVKLVIESETPLALRANRGQDASDTIDYLPGSTLRGGLAAAHALMRPGARDEFQDFFLADRVHFHNGYPCDVNAVGQTDYMSYPVPHTAVTCKRCPGILSETPSDPRQKTHGVRDSLLTMVLLAETSYGNARLLKSLNQCGHGLSNGTPCQEPLDRLSGFFGRAGGASYSRPSHSKELRTRTGISRARGGVHQGILYSREMLSRSSGFQSQLEVDAVCETSLRGFIEEATSSGMIRLGNNRTRGLGGVAVKYLQAEGASSGVDELEERIQRFDAVLRGASANYGVNASHPLYLPILCISDVLLKDGLGRYAGHLDGDWLSAETGLAGASLIHSSAGMRRVSGWNALLGLPRADEWGISMGSVFLLGLTTVLSKSDVQRLLDLERRGTGTRRAEGFGCVRFADPFHLEVNPV